MNIFKLLQEDFFSKKLDAVKNCDQMVGYFIAAYLSLQLNYIFYWLKIIDCRWLEAKRRQPHKARGRGTYAGRK